MYAQFSAIAAGGRDSERNKQDNKSDVTVCDEAVVGNHEGQWSAGLALADDGRPALHSSCGIRERCSPREATASAGKTPTGPEPVVCEKLKTNHIHGKSLACQTIVQRSASSNDLFHNRGTGKPMNISDSVGATFAQMAVSSYHQVFLVNHKIRGL